MLYTPFAPAITPEAARRSHSRASVMQSYIQVEAEQDNISVPGGFWLAL